VIEEVKVVSFARRVWIGLWSVILCALAIPYIGHAPRPLAQTSQSNIGNIVVCDSSVEIDTATSGNTELVALTAGDIIYVCGYNWIAAGTVTVQLVYGTGSACATGETDLTGEMQFTTQTGVSYGGAWGPVTQTAVANALCIELSDTVSVDGILTYAKY
jgi:hypothetical protein